MKVTIDLSKADIKRLNYMAGDPSFSYIEFKMICKILRAIDKAKLKKGGK